MEMRAKAFPGNLFGQEGPCVRQGGCCRERMGKGWPPPEPARKEVSPVEVTLFICPCRNPPQASAGRMGSGSRSSWAHTGPANSRSAPAPSQSTQADSHGSWLSIEDKSDHRTKDFLSPELYSQVTPQVGCAALKTSRNSFLSSPKWLWLESCLVTYQLCKPGTVPQFLPL